MMESTTATLRSSARLKLLASMLRDTVRRKVYTLSKFCSARPVITVFDIPENGRGFEGHSAQLKCGAVGKPQPTYKWLNQVGENPKGAHSFLELSINYIPRNAAGLPLTFVVYYRARRVFAVIESYALNIPRENAFRRASYSYLCTKRDAIDHMTSTHYSIVEEINGRVCPPGKRGFTPHNHIKKLLRCCFAVFAPNCIWGTLLAVSLFTNQPLVLQ